jgi:Leucine-rich repeat (LRR) protein
LLPLAGLTVACSGGDVDLGGGTIVQDLNRSSRCAESTRIEGDVHVANQAELEALAGCEEIGGRLSIETFTGADLAPLGALRVLDTLEIGAYPQILPEDPEEQQAFVEHFYELQAVGNLASLAGLEAIERVNALYLTAILAEDLGAFESLTEVKDGLVIRDAKHLRSLAGLDAENIPLVWVTDSPEFESLEGLATPPTTFYAERVPALANIDALAPANFLGSLILDQTALQSLSALSGFTSASEIYLAGNPALTDIAGLSDLTGVGQLTIVNNPSIESLSALSKINVATEIAIQHNAGLRDISGLDALTELTRFTVTDNPVLSALPEMAGLRSLDTLVITGNDSLQEVSLNFPELVPQTTSIGPRQIELSATQIEVGNNASLQRITTPAIFEAVQYASIYDNPNLIELELGNLERADFLAIENNAALSVFAAPALTTADELVVTNNPKLSPSAFDAVQSFRRDFSGNATLP